MSKDAIYLICAFPSRQKFVKSILMNSSLITDPNYNDRLVVINPTSYGLLIPTDGGGGGRKPPPFLNYFLMVDFVVFMILLYIYR